MTFHYVCCHLCDLAPIHPRCLISCTTDLIHVSFCRILLLFPAGVQRLATLGIWQCHSVDVPLQPTSSYIDFYCLSIRLSVCLYVCMSVCLYVCMSVCLYVCMSVCLYVCLRCSQTKCRNSCSIVSGVS